MSNVAHPSKVEISPLVVDESHAPCRTLPESAGPGAGAHQRTGKQIREAARLMLQADRSLTDEQVAAAVPCSVGTVRRVRRSLPKAARTWVESRARRDGPTSTRVVALLKAMSDGMTPTEAARAVGGGATQAGALLSRRRWIDSGRWKAARRG